MGLPGSGADSSSADSARALFAAGNDFAARGDFRGALALYRRVETLRPNDPNLLANIGLTLARLNRLEEAIEVYRRVLISVPGQHAVLDNLGSALRGLGRFEDARLVHREAIRLAPGRGAYYRNLVLCGGFPGEDPLIARMENMLRTEPLPGPRDRIQLHFALGQALSESGRNEAGFAHFLAGNQLQRHLVTYDEAGTLAAFARMRALFPAELLQAKQGLGDPSPVPLLVVGMPRSGTSLIEQILASHPAIFGAGERADFSLVLGGLLAGLAGRSDADIVAGLDGMELAGLGADYVARLRAAAEAGGSSAGTLRIVDKYPYNALYLGFIHLALPNARLIHCRRAPVETCLSCFARLFEDVPFSYDLGELGRYHAAYAALMEHWRASLPEGVLIEIDYEEIVADLEGAARRMIAHAGLPWDAACLQFHQNRRAVVTESAFQVRRPIYRSSLKKWRPSPEGLAPLLAGLETSLD